jgi:hypothetical protein
MDAICFPKRWVTFNGTHGIISLKIELFIASNPAYRMLIGKPGREISLARLGGCY